MVTRRQFLGALAVPLVSTPAPELRSGAARLGPSRIQSLPPEDAARREELWFDAQQAFTVDRTVVNLNNGGVSPAPAVVQAAMKRHLDIANMLPTRNLWRVQAPQREPLRERMALAFGCEPEEIAFTRNASEGLQICQFGIDLAAGDEVLTTNQDYPRMISTFRQRERREGIVMRQISIPIPAEDDDEIVRRFEAAITPRTKLILMCHVINLTGQILPVRRVVAMARARGIPVIVDGAHAIAHLDFQIRDLDCDYYATSLHKWLFAPHGTGLLYVRRDKISGLWPLMAAGAELDDDIRKFEEIGTHPEAATLATAEALTFHQGLGPAHKEARLRHLRDTWAHRLLEASPRVRLNTSLRPEFSGGIANLHIEGLDLRALNEHLWKSSRILTVHIGHDEFNGLRISPSVYTTREELDRFCSAVETVIAKGLPS